MATCSAYSTTPTAKYDSTGIERGIVATFALQENEDPEVADEQLLLAIADRDEDAFAELFERYAPRLRGFLTKLLQRPGHAEDALQETFLQVWRKASTFNPQRASVRSWLFLIARSRATDLLRSNGARSKREKRRAEEEQRTARPDPSSSLEAKVSMEQLMYALPAAQRECISLTFFGGLSISQVASQLDIPLGTAKSRYLYGLRKLRHAFNAASFSSDVGN